MAGASRYPGGGWGKAQYLAGFSCDRWGFLIGVGSVPSPLRCGSFELFNTVFLSVSGSRSLVDRQDVQARSEGYLFFALIHLSNFAVAFDRGIWCKTELLEMRIRVSCTQVFISCIVWWFWFYAGFWFISAPIYFYLRFYILAVHSFWRSLAGLILFYHLLFSRKGNIWIWAVASYWQEGSLWHRMSSEQRNAPIGASDLSVCLSSFASVGFWAHANPLS